LDRYALALFLGRLDFGLQLVHGLANTCRRSAFVPPWLSASLIALLIRALSSSGLTTRGAARWCRLHRRSCLLNDHCHVPNLSRRPEGPPVWARRSESSRAVKRCDSAHALHFDGDGVDRLLDAVESILDAGIAEPAWLFLRAHPHLRQGQHRAGRGPEDDGYDGDFTGIDEHHSLGFMPGV
jgi:hypothetical protein